MKINRANFPFINNKLGGKHEASVPFLEEEFTQEELMDQIDPAVANKLVEQNRIPEFKRLIDKGTLIEEMGYPDKGVATREYLDSLLGGRVLADNPEFDKMNEVDLVNTIKSKFYPKLDKLSDIAGVSNNVTNAKNDGDHYSEDDGLNIDSNKDIHNRSTKIATILHELGHQSDKAYTKANDKKTYPLIGTPRESVVNSMNEIDLAEPKYKELYDIPNPHEDEMSHGEDGITNSKIPNFNDYDWKKGDFNSDYIRNPTDLQDEVAKKHHVNRNYAFDNLVNYIQKKKII